MTSLVISAAPIVIALPLVAGALTLFLRRWPWAEGGLAALASALAAALLVVARDAPLNLGLVVIDPSAPLFVLGRTLQLEANTQLILAALFAGTAPVLAVAAALPRQGVFFYPLVLGVLSAFAASLMVRPLLFGALAIEAAAAFAAVLIQADRQGARSTQGAVRYLVSATLALPMFFLAFWLAERTPALEGDATSLPVALLLLGNGLLLGAIPLYSWLHAVAKDAPPIVVSTVAVVVLGAAQAWLLRLWDVLAWFQNAAGARFALLLSAQVIWAGVVLIAWAQRSWARLMACALFLEVGAALWSAGVGRVGAEAAFSIAARGLVFAALGAGLHLLRPQPCAEGGVCYAREPLLLALISFMALAGAPGTIGFAVRWLLVRASMESGVETAGLVALAGASLVLGALRTALPMLRCPAPSAPPAKEARLTRLLVGVAIVLLVGFGLLPSPLFFGSIPR